MDNIRVEFKRDGDVNKVWVRFDDAERGSRIVWRFILNGAELLLDAYFVHQRAGSGWKEVKSYDRGKSGCKVNDVMLPKDVLLEAIIVDLTDQLKIVTEPDKPDTAETAPTPAPPARVKH